MRIFVYEYITGGGLWHCRGQEVADSLLAEGNAMLQAAIADFASLAEAEIVTTRDARLQIPCPSRCETTLVTSAKDEWEVLQKLAANADWTLLIAPETGGVLFDRCQLVESARGRLLSPPSTCVGIATSKQATAQWLGRCGIAVPRGELLEPGQSDLPAGFSFPAVAKPVDGCGSVGVRFVRRQAEIQASDNDLPIRVEEFVPGLTASVAVLCGPSGYHALPACAQRLSRDGRFTYRGGRLPLAPPLDARARRLALAAAETLPLPRGYLGVDLVLGEPEDGSGDRVIEINPRLTTSYVGLRVLSCTNLAAAMLAVATGQTPHLCFGCEPVEFTADGIIL